MIYRVELSGRAEKEFSKLDQSVRHYLFNKFQLLETSPDPLINAAKLVGYKNLYRHRFGNYRVIFTLEKDGTIVVLLVLAIAHRKDVYHDLT